MAVTIEKIKPAYNVAVKPATLTEVFGEAVLPYSGGRNGVLLNLVSVDPVTVTIKAGNNVFSGGDLVIDLPGSENRYLKLDPAPYLQTEGPNKGNIVLYSTDARIGAVELD